MTDSGDETQGLLDFVIPRGDTGPIGPTGAAGPKGATGATGADGKLEALAVVDGSDQMVDAGEALVFSNPPLFSSGPFSHQAGEPNVRILRSGVYQAIFQGTVTHVGCAEIPAAVVLQMKMNGASVEGAEVRHTFRDSREVATLTFSVPFRVVSVPANVEVAVAQGDVTVTARALTVVRLGDAPQA